MSDEQPPQQPQPQPDEPEVPQRREQRAQSMVLSRSGAVLITNMADARDLAFSCFNARILPEHVKTKEQALVILLRGGELGLPPFASWRFIYPTRQGKLAIESKGALAVVQASPKFGWYKEWIEGEDGPVESWEAVAATQRKGQAEPTIKRFSFADADRARLTGQKTNRDGQKYDTPWVLYIKDMILAKARDRCLNTAYADVLGGIQTLEEADEIEGLEAQRAGTGPREGAIPKPPPPRDPLIQQLSRAQAALPAPVHTATVIDRMTGRKEPEPVEVKAQVVSRAPAGDRSAPQGAVETSPAAGTGPIRAPGLTPEELKRAEARVASDPDAPERASTRAQDEINASVDEALAQQAGGQPTLFPDVKPQPLDREPGVDEEDPAAPEGPDTPFRRALKESTRKKGGPE